MEAGVFPSLPSSLSYPFAPAIFQISDGERGRFSLSTFLASSRKVIFFVIIPAHRPTFRKINEIILPEHAISVRLWRISRPLPALSAFTHSKTSRHMRCLAYSPSGHDPIIAPLARISHHHCAGGPAPANNTATPRNSQRQSYVSSATNAPRCARVAMSRCMKRRRPASGDSGRSARLPCVSASSLPPCPSWSSALAARFADFPNSARVTFESRRSASTSTPCARASLSSFRAAGKSLFVCSSVRSPGRLMKGENTGRARHARAWPQNTLSGSARTPGARRRAGTRGGYADRAAKETWPALVRSAHVALLRRSALIPPLERCCAACSIC